jgi:type II secretory ATPase GspE/PulE/Tfp pilus assembly ATPase PilB-like protein
VAKTLKEALQSSGVAGAAAIKKADDEAKRAGGSFLMALVSEPGIDPDLVGMVVARHYGLAYSHLAAGRVATALVGQLTLRRLRKLQALPVEQKGNHVTMAAADPGVKDEVEGLLAPKGIRVEWVVVPVKEMEAELGRLLLQQIDGPGPADGRGPAPASPADAWPASGASTSSAGAVLRPGPGAARTAASASAAAPPLLVSTCDESLVDAHRKLLTCITRGDAPAVVDEIVSIAVDLGASDIHVVSDAGRLSVRFRRDGVLRSLAPACPPELAPSIISRIKVIAELDITETRMPQDGRTRLELGSRKPPLSVLMRVSTVPSRQGEKVSLRILEKGSRLLGLREVGLSAGNYRRLTDSLLHPNGVFLVTGPTGCGKTTTVYAALQHLRDDSMSIFTIEDPIEYELAGTYQCQVHDAIGLNFPVMLRALLRQDPNVMLVGEMRDSETAKIAFEAGLTGHFVVSTLHANSATTAVTRLLEMDVEPFVIGTCTRAIVAQRLVRLLCACKRPIYRMPDDLVRIKDQLGVVGSRVYEPGGCPACSFGGYSGRIAIHEILTMDPTLSDLILARASASQILAAAKEKGYQPMIADGFAKVLAGLTTSSEIVRQLGPPVVS